MPDGEIDAQQAKAEKYNEDKIKDALHYCGGEVIAVVHAKVDTIASQISETTHPKIQSKPVKEENETNNTVMPQPAASEPGAAANTGGTLSVGGNTSAAASSTTDTEKNTTESQIITDEKVETSVKPPGESKAISATVLVPRSYFIRVLKANSASDKEPDPADVEKTFALQRAGILAQVVNAVGLPDPTGASVDMYYDAPLMMAAARGQARMDRLRRQRPSRLAGT